MKQKIKAILDEERGVSPVIGVILMVAITVILAAVIGTFVLGLGDSLQQAPQAQLDAELESSEIVVNHNGGDKIEFKDIAIEVDGATENSTLESTSNYELTVGNSVTVTDGSGSASSGSTVTLVHEPSESIILEVTV